MRSLGPKPMLFATMGYPGSGKTYFTKKFAQEIGAVRLSSDELRNVIFTKPSYTLEENSKVFGALNFMTEKLLANGISVILDANSAEKRHRRADMKRAKKLGARYYILWLQTPFEVAVKRATRRDKNVQHRPVTREVVLRFKNHQENPTKGEPYLVLDGEATYDNNKKKVLQYLKKFSF